MKRKFSMPTICLLDQPNFLTQNNLQLFNSKLPLLSSQSNPDKIIVTDKPCNSFLNYLSSAVTGSVV